MFGVLYVFMMQHNTDNIKIITDGKKEYIYIRECITNNNNTYCFHKTQHSNEHIWKTFLPRGV